MSKIVLNDVTNLNALAVINDNFDKIEQELQNKVLYRNNPNGEPNSLETSVDANDKDIFNVRNLSAENFTVNGKNVEEVVDAAIEGVQQSAESALNSAASATASATAASNSQIEAATSAANAANSASQASTSASNAAASESNASSSASNANTSAVNAAASASAAASSATAASNSAVAAATSESNAADSAASANQSKIDTETVAKRYQGDKASAPTVRNDGGALQAGDLYFDTTLKLNEMRVYDGSIWKSAGSTVNGTAVRQTFTATAGQTSFTITGGYDAGFADVYLNGVKLVNGVDVDVTSGTAVVLTVGAALNDVVDVIAYGAFVLANHYTQAQTDALLAAKQNTLVSGTNIKTINGQSILGEGDLLIEGGVTEDGTQTLSNKTYQNAVFDGSITEEVFTITDDVTITLDPANGTIQFWTLGANRIVNSTSFSNLLDGQSLTLLIDDGTSRTISWGGVVWKTNGGVAPALQTSGFTVIVFWRAGTTVFGARVGDA